MTTFEIENQIEAAEFDNSYMEELDFSEVTFHQLHCFYDDDREAAEKIAEQLEVDLDDLEALLEYGEREMLDDKPVADSLDRFHEAYIGFFERVEDLAMELAEDCLDMNSWPETAQNYFDYEAWGRDLCLGGDVDYDWRKGFDHAFWNNI